MIVQGFPKCFHWICWNRNIKNYLRDVTTVRPKTHVTQRIFKLAVIYALLNSIKNSAPFKENSSILSVTLQVCKVTKFWISTRFYGNWHCIVAYIRVRCFNLWPVGVSCIYIRSAALRIFKPRFWYSLSGCSSVWLCLFLNHLTRLAFVCILTTCLFCK